MRGKNDATTYPDKLCFNVLSTVPRENRLADFLYYIYICLKCELQSACSI